MLGDHPIDVVLPATDLATSKQFYAGKLGLETLNEGEDAINYKCGARSPSSRPGLRSDGLIVDPHGNALAIMELRWRRSLNR